MSVLERIVSAKREEVEALAGRERSLREAAERSASPRRFAAALRRRPEEVALIGEVKRRSPSAGALRPELSPGEIVGAYEGAGAAAVSVLTDADFFGGGLSDLRAAREAVRLPALRKDFVLAPVQLWEARAAGADAVLLIARILDDGRLGELLAAAAEVELDALVEVHDATELDRALAAGATMIGINNRDLSTFRTELEVALGLAGAVPGDRVLVAESGIRSPDDVDRLGAVGVDAVLVGESLMRAADIGGAARALVGRARVARGRGVEAAP